MQYCGTPGCPTLVPRGRCAAHTRVQARQVDAYRGTAQSRGYDYRWSQVSAYFRKAHPVCGERFDGSLDTVNSRCAQRGLTTMAECVDHTIPKTQGGTDDETNLMSACLACNTWKAQTIERGMPV